jgi:hypothetical protein
VRSKVHDVGAISERVGQLYARLCDRSLPRHVRRDREMALSATPGRNVYAVVFLRVTKRA